MAEILEIWHFNGIVPGSLQMFHTSFVGVALFAYRRKCNKCKEQMNNYTLYAKLAMVYGMSGKGEPILLYSEYMLFKCTG